MIEKILVKSDKKNSLYYLINKGDSITSVNTINGNKSEMLRIAKIKGYKVICSITVKEGLEKGLMSI